MYINCVDLNEMLFLGSAFERVYCALYPAYVVMEFESLTL